MDIKRDTSFMYPDALYNKGWDRPARLADVLWKCRENSRGTSTTLWWHQPSSRVWSGDKERLCRLVRKASSVLGCSLDSAEEETAKLSSMLETLSHPLQGILATLGCPSPLLLAYCGQILQEAHLAGWSLSAPSLLLTIADAIVLCTAVYTYIWLFFACLSYSPCLPLNRILLLLQDWKFPHSGTSKGLSCIYASRFKHLVTFSLVLLKKTPDKDR